MQCPDPTLVQSHFDQRSTNYSDLFDDSIQTGAGHKFQRRRKIVAQLTGHLSGRLLDCASGTGEVTLTALNSGNFDSAVVNDLSAEMLSRANSLIDDEFINPCLVQYSNAGVFDLPNQFQPASFDVILCLGLIAHVGRLDEMFGLCHGLLAPQGRLLFQSTLLDHFGVRMTKRISEKRHVRHKGYAIKHYWHDEILKSSSRNGLEVADCRRYGLDIPFMDRVAPRVNFRLEQRFSSLSKRAGSEAIYVLGKTHSADRLKK